MTLIAHDFSLAFTGFHASTNCMPRGYVASSPGQSS